MRILFIAILCLPLTLAAQKFEQSYSGVESIQLTTGSSSCEIRRSSGNEVTVIVEHTLGDQYQPSVDQRGSRLLIKDGERKGTEGSQKYTLIVPNDLSLKYTAGSGDIEAEGLTIDIEGNTGSGNITLKDMSGSLKMNCGSGDLTVEDYSGKLALNTGSGDSDISGFQGELGINSGSGDIEMNEVNASIKVNTGSGKVDGEGIIIAGKSAFNAGSGDISIQLDEGLKHNLSINTGSGHSMLDFDGNAFTGTIVMEADKRKGEIKAPFSFDTEEEITENDQVKIRKTAVLGGDAVEIKMATGSGVVEVQD